MMKKAERYLESPKVIHYMLPKISKNNMMNEKYWQWLHSNRRNKFDPKWSNSIQKYPI